MTTESYTTNQDFIMLLSQRLKEYRLAARISQKEMAEKSGMRGMTEEPMMNK